MTFFWSEIESGFLEPGGTPTTIIPRNTLPPGLQLRLVRTTLVTTTRLQGSREASWWLHSYSNRGNGLVTVKRPIHLARATLLTL